MNPVLQAWNQAPDHPVLRGPGQVITSAEALQDVYRLARALIGRGCGPGRAVALFGPVSPRMFLVSHAVQLAGGAQVEVPLALEGVQQVRLVRECAPALTVADPACVDAATLKQLAHDRPLLTLAPAGRGEDLFALCRTHDSAPLACRAQEGSPARISMTGGTTGRSKPVVRSFGPVPTRASALLGQILSRGPEAPNVLLADRLTGMSKTIGDMALARGGILTTLADYGLAPLLAALDEQPITHAVLPSHVLRRLLEEPAAAGADLSGLQALVVGGGPLSPALLERALDRLGPILYCTYGQTEAGNIAWLGPQDYLGRDPEVLRSCGRPSPGVQVQIRGSGGQVLAPRERGRVWVRTPLMMQGYLGRPEATDRVLRQGWLDTEDVGFLDERGYLTLLGRAGEAMRIGTSTVHATEVDAVLQTHRGVSDSATFDVAEPGGGASLHAAVVVRSGQQVSDQVLQDLVRRSLGPGHEPCSIMFVSHLPYTYAHELCRPTLRAWHRQGPPAEPAHP